MCSHISVRHKIWYYIVVFTVFRLLTDFVCLYTYEFWLSLCKIVRSSVILLLPLFAYIFFKLIYAYRMSPYGYGVKVKWLAASAIDIGFDSQPMSNHTRPLAFLLIR
jgi:hypothetical protein